MGREIHCRSNVFVFGFDPCGDQRSEGGIGREGPMVAVAVDAGWREDLGQAVEELES